MSGIRGRGFGADAPQTADRPIPVPRSPTLRTQEVPNGLVHTQTDDGTLPDDVLSVDIEPIAGQQTQAIAELQAAFGQNLPKGIVFTTEPQQEYYNQTILRRFQELVTKNFAGVLGLGLWLMLVTVGISGYFAMLLNIRSIGIKRSLGASKRTIFYFFVRSGLYTGLFGGGGGLVCAWFVRSLGQRLDVEQPVFGWLTVSITLVAAVVISTASYSLTGVYAMNLPPSVAMRERIGKTLAGRRWLLGGSSIAAGLLALILILGLRSGLAARMDEILGWTGARTISAVS